MRGQKNNFKDSEKNRPTKLNRGSVFYLITLKKSIIMPPKKKADKRKEAKEN